MTARWFGVPGEGGRDAPAPGIWRSNVGGFSHGARQKVSEGDVSTGAREQETSVVEAKLEASWCLLPRKAARSHEGKTPSDGRGHRTRTGSMVIHRAAKVPRVRNTPQGAKRTHLMVESGEPV